MKFVCEGMILSEAAFVVSKACAIRTMTPVLECIKLKAENDKLILTAYDGEISIEKKIQAEVMDEGEVCVNGRFFADFMGKISYNEVIISSTDSGIVVKYGDSETNIQTLPADDFPVINIEQISKDTYFEIKQNDLKELVSKVTFCCATDESRPILKGCLLEAKEGKLYATALDGLRMASGYADTTDGGNMKIVCPARTLTEIARMLEGDEGLKIYADKNRLLVSVDNTVITSRLYAGEFVRKENIFPAAFASIVSVQKSELMHSIERAGVLTRGDKNNLVIFDIKNNKIVINANSDMGKIEETVNTALEGKELKIAMNGKFLLDAVKALTEENIVMSFNMPNSPFTIENAEDKRFQYLVMPMRTGN